MERISIAEYRALLQTNQRRPNRRTKTGVDGTLLEEGEQRILAEFLDGLGIPWFHVPNGGARCAAEGGKLKAQGVKSGVPDNFIVEPPPNGPPGCPGAVIELKRKKGGTASADQKGWLAILEQRGWLVKVCHGAEEAMDFVAQLGYAKRKSQNKGRTHAASY